jgi:hypothetical protein
MHRLAEVNHKHEQLRTLGADAATALEEAIWFARNQWI